MYNETKVHVELFLASPTTSGYENMCSRNFQINLNDTKVRDKVTNVFGKIREQAIGNQRGNWIQNVGTAVINNNLNGLITSSNVASLRSEIPNGWNAQRYTFLMKIHTKVHGLEVLSVVEGYSEHYDPSIANAVDFNLKYYINKITNYNKSISGSGNVTYTLENSYNLLADHTADKSVSNLLGGPINDKVLTRPSDIHNKFYNEMNYGNDEIVIESASNYGNKCHIMDVTEGSKDNHMAKVINSLLTTRNDPKAGTSTADIVFNTAMKTIGADHLETPFIMLLKQSTLRLNVNSFTLAEIAMLDPTINQPNNTVIKIGSGSPINGNQEHNMRNLHNPNGSSYEAIVASDIRNKFTEICSYRGYDALSLGFSNLNRSVPVVSVLPGSTPMERIIDDDIIIRKHIIEELLPSISKNGLVTVKVIVHYVKLGNTVVGVSIEDKEMKYIPFPEFGSSLYSSVISTKNESAKLAGDYDKIINLTYDESPVDMKINMDSGLDDIGTLNNQSGMNVFDPTNIPFL